MPVRFPACAAAFDHPESIEFEGQMISGVTNTVRLQVASLPDFIIMKVHALEGRDKPKDVYDLCYCLDEHPDAIAVVRDLGRYGRRSRRKLALGTPASEERRPRKDQQGVSAGAASIVVGLLQRRGQI